MSSEVNGPSVSVVPSGCVTTTVMFCHRSPYCPFAVGGGWPNQKLTRAVWPTPMGSGEAVQNEKVGILMGGWCALAFSISVTEIIVEIKTRVNSVFTKQFN